MCFPFSVQGSKARKVPFGEFSLAEVSWLWNHLPEEQWPLEGH